MVPESVRIRFSKKGRLRYISHLDLCRAMVSAIARAKLPIWYTEGFNPHPKLVFTQPLPLFAESECELLDIKIVEPMSHREICRRLREALTPELYIEEAYTPAEKFTAIDAATYRIVAEGYDPALLTGDGELKVVKSTKDGKGKEVSIRSQIRCLTIEEDGSITAVLDASASSYLNPDLLCRAIGATDYFITRTGWLRADGSCFR